MGQKRKPRPKIVIERLAGPLLRNGERVVDPRVIRAQRLAKRHAKERAKLAALQQHRDRPHVL